MASTETKGRGPYKGLLPTPDEWLDERLQEIGGCMDGNCIVWRPRGMHTNGGCRCNMNKYKMLRVIDAYKRYRALVRPTQAPPLRDDQDPA